jgi:hypothetical protein
MAQPAPAPHPVQPPSPVVTSIIRTLAPIIVGFLISRGVVDYFDITDDQATQFVTSLLTAAWYLLFRLFEAYVSPKFGWALGIASQPLYLARDGRHELGRDEDTRNEDTRNDRAPL